MGKQPMCFLRYFLKTNKQKALAKLFFQMQVFLIFPQALITMRYNASAIHTVIILDGIFKTAKSNSCLCSLLCGFNYQLGQQ